MTYVPRYDRRKVQFFGPKSPYGSVYCGAYECAPLGGFSHVHVVNRKKMPVATVYDFQQARDWVAFDGQRAKSQEELWREWRLTETARLHPRVEHYMSGLYLAKCPKCGQRRFDTIARACERRQCGYIDPPARVSDSKINKAVRKRL